MGPLNQPALAMAVSGGIDSLVAAFLLKQSFSNIFGIHFRTGYEHSGHISRQALEDCLGMDVICVDMSREFEKNVVSDFIDTYLAGQTPNPCVMCNGHIKFGGLLEKAKILGAQYLATGHYARVVNACTFPDHDIPCPWIEQARDPKKDQSYFLARLGDACLEHLLFPLGDLSKDQVRQVAKDQGLVPLHPSESQDICFLSRKTVREFIEQRTGFKSRSGPIKDMDGKIIGTHQGLLGFTLGQRRGIDCPAKEPYYVKKIDMHSNTLHVCPKDGLGETTALVSEMLWNKAFPFSNGICVDTKIRYAHLPAPSKIVTESGETKILFDQPQSAVTPGQTAVFYNDRKLLGSGIIQESFNENIPNHHPWL